MKRAIILFLVLLLVAGVVGGFVYFQYYVKPGMIQQAMSAGGQPPVTVTAEEAKSETWQPRVPAIGTLVAVRGIDVAPQVEGVIETVHFESGQDVAAGDRLVTIDHSVEEADLQSATAQLTRANLDLERQRDLLQRGNTPKASYDAAVAARDSAAGDAARIRAVIQQKRIEAPFPGRLGIGHVDPGEYVSPGTAMVTLQQLDPIYADFPLPEQTLSRLAVGQAVEVAVDAFPQGEFAGEVVAIDARVDQETRNILLRARIPNPALHLLPGMFANVTVLAGKERMVTTVPRTAVTYSLYGDSVYVVKDAGGQGGQDDQEGGQEVGQTGGQADGQAGGAGGAAAAQASQPGGQQGQTVERRFVQSGEVRGDRVEIVEGVTPGETVVSSGQLKLYPGAAIRVDNSRPLEAPAQRPRE